jgi:hypothetical protein
MILKECVEEYSYEYHYIRAREISRGPHPDEEV